jgi:hypothetical protein
MAGERYEAFVGNQGMTAGDLVERIPYAFSALGSE